jgi:hypothetical protein
MADERGSRELWLATGIGTMLQLIMVIAGHYNASIAQLFAFGGMGISLLAGVLYSVWAHPATAAAAVRGGAIAGGVCALIGIVVSFFLGDVTAVIIALGTFSSAVTGLIGGLIGRALSPSRAVA